MAFCLSGAEAWGQKGPSLDDRQQESAVCMLPSLLEQLTAQATPDLTSGMQGVISSTTAARGLPSYAVMTLLCKQDSPG